MDKLSAAMKSPTKGGSMAPDTPVRQKSSASLRPSTPQARLLGRGSLGSLRRLRSRLSLGSLRKGSPERKDVTTLSAHVTGGSPVHKRPAFRPLSIVNTALHPFDFDVAAAMQAVQNQTGSSPSTMASQQEGKEPLAQIPRLSNEEREDDEVTVKPSGRSDEDLRSQASSPPPPTGAQERANDDNVVTSGFRALVNLPPPDLSQHPAFQTDPMAATSDAPLLVTTSTAEEIQQWARERRELAAERGDGSVGAQATSVAAPGTNNGGGDPSTAAAMTPRRRAVRFVTPTSLRRREAPPSSEARAPGGFSLRTNFSRLRLDTDNAETATGGAHAEGASMASPTAQPKTPVDSSKQASTPASQEVAQKKTGLRKVTGLFKSKSDKAQPDPTSPLPDRPDYTRSKQDLEHYLRVTSNCRSEDYDPGQPYPRHPNTGRAWHSRNLKCTNCLDVLCAVCGRTCCAYKAASAALENHKTNPISLRAAQDRLANISNLFPFGREVPTFLQCTHGGGCGKMVCPDCCGMCPNPICADIQCRKCKKDPWSECDWHEHMDTDTHAL